MAITVHVSVAEKIAQLSKSSGVQDKLATHLAEIELKKRLDAVIKAWVDLEKLEKMFSKLGPDFKTYNPDGSIKEESYTKTRLDDRNKCNSKIEKWKKAIDKALSGDKKEDFADVYNLGNVEDKGSGGGEATE